MALPAPPACLEVKLSASLGCRLVHQKSAVASADTAHFARENAQRTHAVETSSIAKGLKSSDPKSFLAVALNALFYVEKVFSL